MGIKFDYWDDSIIVPDHPSLRITPNLTITLWARWLIPSVGYGFIISKKDGPSDFTQIPGYMFYSSYDGSYWGYFVDIMSNGWDSGSSSFYKRHNWTGDAEFHHWAAVIEGNTLTMYLDGVGINGGYQGQPAALAAGTQPLRIGVRTYTTLERSINAVMEDIRIYNRALSANEIQQIYNSKLRYGIIEGLVGYWTLDEVRDGTNGGGTKIWDRSGNNNHTEANAGGDGVGMVGQETHILTYPCGVF